MFNVKKSYKHIDIYYNRVMYQYKENEKEFINPPEYLIVHKIMLLQIYRYI